MCSHYSELTTGPVSAGLECPSCHRLIFDPYVLTCGHTLCSKCLRSCSVCPLDNKPFMTPVPNKQVEVFLKQTTTIRCKFGCGAQFTISQEVRHFPYHAQSILGRAQGPVHPCLFKLVAPPPIRYPINSHRRY